MPAEELVEVDGIGAVLADAWIRYFADEKNQETVDHLLSELTLSRRKNRRRKRS